MWLRIALVTSLLTPFLHIVVLFSSGLDGIETPISELSGQPRGALHTLALVLFATAHGALAAALGGLDSGRFWPYGRVLLALSGAALLYIAFFFATAGAESLRGPAANDPLWIVATLIGFAMGALQPGLSRQARTLGWFNLACVVIWLLLIPTILLVDDSWIGAYERIVGSVYVVWIVGVALGLVGRAPHTQKA
ncbi:MAG: DUF998 domain-containing protein [Pseudomonadota bacterium]